MGNLWIGPPGSMYEIDQAAKSFDRTADLGVSEFKSLGGRVTVTRNLAPVRRIKLAWDLLPPAHARALDRIARRVDATVPATVFLVDPAAGNVLTAGQALGQGTKGATDITGLARWFKTTTGTVAESTTAPGTFTFTSADTNSAVAWRCVATVSNFPVSPGLQVSFRAPTAIAALGTASVGLDFKKADGSYISTASAIGPLVTGTVPAGAAYVTPTAKPGTVGTYSLAGACLTYGGTAADGVPGDGLPPMAVTGYSDAPGRPLPYRNFSLDLVEVSSAVG
ncbi:hypothetical protein PV416_35110 [Streptomyces ipomoeae]|uniref:hypothetical protein n=1 Tax=Streptomyces ipomoeae TaxID=103232 RepID=UPI0029A2A449|nr:hypothetical protein [Streptomyces ipomoeae]MDX2826157.1 hypothetical protein [Streptomyces ipomoeae]MDX2872541.1 hypothetical protein [Streptomyces ipomoeae]